MQEKSPAVSKELAIPFLSEFIARALPSSKSEALPLANEMAIDPSFFLKMADLGLEAMSKNVLIWRDASLWDQLKAAKEQPLEARVSLLNELVERQKNAQEFQDLLRAEVPDFHATEAIRTVVNRYFPLYRDGIRKCHAAVIRQIKWILDRGRVPIDWIELEKTEKGLLFCKKARTALCAYLGKLKELSDCDLEIHEARESGNVDYDLIAKRARVSQEFKRIAREHMAYLNIKRLRVLGAVKK